MATNTNTPAKATTPAKGKGKAAPAPTPAKAAPAKAAPAQQAPAQQGAVAVPAAPLYTVGTLPPVQPGSIRAYAQHVAKALATQHPKGFTLAQYRAALVATASTQQGQGYKQPRHGWAKHNMPQWALAQGWLAPVGS